MQISNGQTTKRFKNKLEVIPWRVERPRNTAIFEFEFQGQTRHFPFDSERRYAKADTLDFQILPEFYNVIVYGYFTGYKIVTIVKSLNLSHKNLETISITLTFRSYRTTTLNISNGTLTTWKFCNPIPTTKSWNFVINDLAKIQRRSLDDFKH